MDQHLSTVIIALITGIFSIITLIIQRKQDKVISKIDEQTTFIDREKDLKKKLREKEKEREVLIQEILLLIVDSNICLLQNTNINDNKSPEEIYKRANKLKIQFDDIVEEIEEINKEYSLVIDITNEIQKEIERNKNN